MGRYWVFVLAWGVGTIPAFGLLGAGVKSSFILFWVLTVGGCWIASNILRTAGVRRDGVFYTLLPPFLWQFINHLYDCNETMGELLPTLEAWVFGHVIHLVMVVGLIYLLSDEWEKRRVV